MVKKTIALMLCSVGVFGAATIISSNRAIGQTLTSELLTQLKKGGFVIYCRHGKTDWSQSDQDISSTAKCELQRNLSAEGRAQMFEVGSSIKRLEIPVGAVLASPFCRTRESAEIAFGRLVTTDRLRESMKAGTGLAKENVAQLRSLLHEKPTSFTNTVLISHQPLMEALNGLDIQQGECAIFDPARSEDLPVARVPSEFWGTL